MLSLRLLILSPGIWLFWHGWYTTKHIRKISNFSNTLLNDFSRAALELHEDEMGAELPAEAQAGEFSSSGDSSTESDSSSEESDEVWTREETKN